MTLNTGLIAYSNWIVLCTLPINLNVIISRSWWEFIVLPVDSQLAADLNSRRLHSRNLHRTVCILTSGVSVWENVCSLRARCSGDSTLLPDVIRKTAQRMPKHTHCVSKFHNSCLQHVEKKKNRQQRISIKQEAHTSVRCQIQNTW